jgi:CubicO group peptidase (beta-lactamase class C family)
VDDYLALFADDPLLFTPGERFEYSNSGFIVLGRDRREGERDAVRRLRGEADLRTAGMTHTDFSAIADSMPSRAIRYMFADGDDAPPQAMDFATPAPASQPHWNTFPIAVAQQAAGTRRSATGHASPTPSPRASWWASRGSTRYGPRGRAGRARVARPGRRVRLWFHLRVGDEGRVVGHTGGAPGVAGALAIYIDRGWTVAVLANLDPPALLNVYEKVTAGVAG